MIEHGKWLMTIVCDSLEEQDKRDPELAFPNDEISQIVGKLTSMWGGLLEEFTEDAEWDSTKITVTFDVLDHISGFTEWLLMNVIPRSFTLTQEG